VVDSYRTYLKRAAIGIPLAPFSSQLWSGVGNALKELFQTLATLLACIAILALYPASAFVLAAIATRNDRQAVARSKRYFEGMNRSQGEPL
jgi:hypothetical protein